MHTPLFSHGYEQQGLWPPEITEFPDLQTLFTSFSQSKLSAIHFHLSF